MVDLIAALQHSAVACAAASVQAAAAAAAATAFVDALLRLDALKRTIFSLAALWALEIPLPW